MADQFLEGLNAEQSRAASHGDGPLLIIADVVAGAVPPRRTDAAPRGQPEVVSRSRPLEIAFEAAPSREVTFRVLDEHGKPATAAFLIRDAQDRVYPSQAKRLAPDFAFHPQVYRFPWTNQGAPCDDRL